MQEGNGRHSAACRFTRLHEQCLMLDYQIDCSQVRRCSQATRSRQAAVVRRWLRFALFGWALFGWALFGIATTCSTAQAADVDVYLLGGQSNMQGIGKIANLPADVAKQIPHAYFFNGKSFEPLIIGKTKISVRAGDFGPEVGFAQAVATPERPAYIIKYDASGMGLHHGWNGGKWLGGEPAASRRNFYPGQNQTDEIRGTLYRQMLKKFRSGIAAVRTSGNQPIVRGFVWMQGEQDAKQQLSATTYGAGLKRLRSRLQEDLGLSQDIAMAYGQVLPYEPALPRFTHRRELREQMELLDSSSEHPGRAALATMVSTDDCELLPDKVHYNAAGQLRLGAKLGKAIQQLQSSE